MIGLSGQSWLALGMVAVAAGYLLLYAYRALRGIGSGQGCCGSGCPSARQPPAEPLGQGDARPFVPLDDFADAARRHQQERGQSDG